MTRQSKDPVIRRFCEETGIGPTQVNRLLAKAGAAAMEQTTAMNSSVKTGLNGKTTEFEDYASSLGFKIQWPGLYPLVTKNGRSATLSGDGIS